MSHRQRFFPAGMPVPQELNHPEFHLEPLTPAHTPLDYAALMESRELLRLWSGSPWPQDDFTLVANEEDLAWHAREHRERIAFTYTVLDPAGDTCLGCVYIKSLATLVAEQTENPGRLAVIGDFEAAVRFWVTAPRLAGGLDRQLLDALNAWFAREWPFRRVLYHTRVVNKQQLALFREAGLAPVWTLTMPGRGGAHQFWEEPAVGAREK